MSRITVAYAGSDDPKRPTVDVLMVNSRGKAHPWLLSAINSVKAQSHHETMLLVLDNNDHALTIGQAYNTLVEDSSAEFVLFLSDDDLLTVDMVGSSLACLLSARKRSKAVIHTTSNTMILMEQNGTIANAPIPHLGMFEREFLRTNRFNEALTKGIDLDMHRRLDSFSKLRGAPVSIPVTHQHGYIFRQHIGMAGGMRVQLPATSPLSATR